MRNKIKLSTLVAALIFSGCLYTSGRCVAIPVMPADPQNQSTDTNKKTDSSEVPEDKDEPTGPVDPTVEPLPARPPASELFPFENMQLWTEAPRLPQKKAPLLFIAPFDGASDSQTTLATTVNYFLRWHIRGAPKGQLLVNLVPLDHIRLTSGQNNSKYANKVDREAEYLRDASAMGADIFVYAKVGGEDLNPSVSVRLLELTTSRTEVFTLGPLSPESLERELVTKCARFCGLDKSVTEQSGMLSGLPKNSTWEFWLGRTTDINKAISADPECRFLYTYLAETWSPGCVLDQGLKKWPNDPRLIREKYNDLEEQGRHFAALLMIMGQLSRTPDEQLSLASLATVIPKFYKESAAPRFAPVPFQASINLSKSVLERYPKYWVGWWNLAYLENCLGWYSRGTRTINKIAETALNEASRHTLRAIECVDRAYELQPNVPRLAVFVLDLHSKGGQKDVKWQLEMINRVLKLDPENVSAELGVAQSYSIGWGDPKIFWLVVNKAMENHKNDPVAMAEIGQSMSTELERLVGWKALTYDKAFKEKNEITDNIIKCSEYAIAQKIQLERTHFLVLFRIYKEQFGEEKTRWLNEEAGQWYGCHYTASIAHKENNWEKCLKFADLAISFTPYDERHYREGNCYFRVKSLWKLKRYDEALGEARNGIKLFPDKQTFHYMFAVVAESAESNTEEGYNEALKAVDIYTSNTDANRVFERFRTKLNKPPHPKLKEIPPASKPLP